MAKTIKNQLAGKLEDALSAELKNQTASPYENLSEEELFTLAE